MRFTIDRDAFAAALDRARKVSAKSHARLAAADGVLTVYGADVPSLFVACQAPISLDARGECGVLPGELCDQVKRMPKGLLTFAVEGTKAKLTAPGSKRGFSIAVVPAECLPASKPASKAAGMTIAGDTLADHLHRVLDCASTDQARAHIHGVAFDVDVGALSLVATDGHRLASSGKMASDALPEGVRVLQLHAAKLLANEAAAMDQIRVVIDSAGFSFSNDTTGIFVPHIEGAFPKYSQVLASTDKNATSAKLDVKDALASVGAMLAVAKEGATLLTLNGSVRLMSQGERDTAEDEMSATVAGPKASVKLNSGYLYAAVKASTEETCTLSAGGELDPITITSRGYRCLVSLMRQ